jgi:hypothetical protein
MSSAAWLREGVMVSLACGVIGCGETAGPPEYAMLFDLTYQTELEQQGIELRWGSAQARGGPSINTVNSVELQRGFATRAEALALADPARVLVGGAMIHSELLSFAACDVVAAHGPDLSAVRLARFFRRMDDAGQTVSPLPAMYFSVPIVCYTSTRLTETCQSTSRDRQELLYGLHLPEGQVSFTLDGETLIPYGLGFDGFSTEMIVYLRITRPVGSAGDSLGSLVVTHDGVASAPFDVTINAACKQETASGALLQQSLYLKWGGGQLALDTTFGYACYYQNGLCRGGSSLPN